MNIRQAKELIQRNIDAGVKWIEQSYNRCHTDADILRLAIEINTQSRRNIQRIKNSYVSKT